MQDVLSPRAMITVPFRQDLLRVLTRSACGSRVHSARAKALALTFIQLAEPYSGHTILVHCLFMSKCSEIIGLYVGIVKNLGLLRLTSQEVYRRLGEGLLRWLNLPEMLSGTKLSFCGLK